MKQQIIIAAMAAAVLSSCGGRGTTAAGTSAADTITSRTVQSIAGQWYIENIVESDSVSVRPGEEAAAARPYIIFTDSTYSVMTNCNSISGIYIINGDSIAFRDGAMTELACDNMAVEEAVCRILPKIATVGFAGDSVVRLNGGNPSEYVLLRKTTFETK